MLAQSQEIQNLLAQQQEIAAKIIQQKEQECYQHSKNIDAYAECMWMREKRIKKQAMKQEFFWRFCDLHYEECLKVKSESSCLKSVSWHIDEFNYQLKQGQVQRI